MDRAEYLAGWQRTQADFDNYRKRALRQQQEFAARGAERLLAKLLPVLDDDGQVTGVVSLRRAVAAVQAVADPA